MATQIQRAPVELPTTPSVQLLVEGKDESNFFDALVKHLKLPCVQIRDFGGVDKLSGYLAGLVKAPRFSIVRQIGIVRDAEKSATSAFASVQFALRNAGLTVPDQPATLAPGKPNVSVLVLPDGADSGMLETVLCKTFADTPVDRCIDELFACVRPILSKELKRPEKARCRVWLATKPDPHLSVGVAAKRGYWNLDHSALAGVRAFLKALCRP